jgi:mannan endo-1,4-beta-mannosidase
LADTHRLGRHRYAPPVRSGVMRRRRAKLAAMTIAAVGIVAAIFTSLAVYGPWRPAGTGHSVPQRQGLHTASASFIGLYARGVPNSYAPVNAFTTITGIKPSLVTYYSGWLEPFQSRFAIAAANHGAVPIVQINPTGINLAAIADGRYDSYLSTYAKAVRTYGKPVIVSFGHEMNGYWYSWGYRHTSPAVFVAAWRHIVTLFRTLGVQNVTWLWTVNNIHKKTRVPSPGPWWPGQAYVNWVGIDGYYTNPSAVFASVFGPTIVYLRTLTHDPILITETSATPATDQPEKIADLFQGIHLYGLLGFVWFNSVDKIDWRISSPEAMAALRQGAETYHKAAS